MKIVQISFFANWFAKISVEIENIRSINKSLFVMLMNISKTKTTSDNQQNMLLLYQTEIHLNCNSNELHWEGFNCKIECKIENSQFKVAVQSREKKWLVNANRV